MPVVRPLKIVGGPDALGKIVIDGKALVGFLEQYKSLIALAVVERVHAMPDQGVSSMFRFGEGYGIVQGVLYAFGIRMLMPPPSVWKARLSLTQRKDDSLSLASNIFGPANTDRYFSRKKDNGRAEAALLAVYGAQSLK